MTDFELPVIDISCWDLSGGVSETRRDVIRKWDHAFSNYGFAVIVGHGIPSETIDRVRQESLTYFANPVTKKMLDSRGPYGCPAGGYTPCSAETVSKSMRSSEEGVQHSVDQVESFVFQPSSTKHPDFPNSFSYWRRLPSLMNKLHEISAHALGLSDENYFERYFDVSHPSAAGTQPPNLALRLAYYPPGPIGSSRYGAHTDYLTFTLLQPDPSDWSVEGGGGLEVLITNETTKLEHWIPVKLPDHAYYGFVVNAGDLIQRWTNDRWRSPVHRVVAPKQDSIAATRERLSVVFFTGPLLDCTISVLPNMPKPGSEPKYEPVVVGDYLQMKLNPTAVPSNVI